MAEKEALTGAETNTEAAAAETEAQPQVGPEGAAPHWREFYQAIRDAVEAMRS